MCLSPEPCNLRLTGQVLSATDQPEVQLTAVPQWCDPQQFLVSLVDPLYGSTLHDRLSRRSIRGSGILPETSLAYVVRPSQLTHLPLMQDMLVTATSCIYNVG